MDMHRLKIVLVSAAALATASPVARGPISHRLTESLGEASAAPAAAPACPCVPLAGRGRVVRFAIVPAGFDDADPAQVADFERLARTVADGFAATEPFASNLDRFSMSRVDDYRGRVFDPWTCAPLWYNATLIEAAGACDYTQIIVIPRRSGCVGGNPAGNFSMAGPGHCPTGGCSADQIIFTALHEVGHTLAGLRHICFPASASSPVAPAELNTGPPIYLPVAQHGSAPSGPGAPVASRDATARTTAAAPRTAHPSGAVVLPRPDLSHAPAASPLPNCGVGFTGTSTVACSEWQDPAVLRWVLSGDPAHGCFRGCDSESAWYRPWPHDEPAVMCRDDAMKNGFTPIERRVIHDILAAPAPPPRPGRCALVCPRTISDVDDWRRVVLTCDGRIWQPEIVPGEPCSEFEVAFEIPDGGDYIFNGISTELWVDDDGDDMPDRRIVDRATGRIVHLDARRTYFARSFQPSPGFELLPARSATSTLERAAMPAQRVRRRATAVP